MARPYSLDLRERVVARVASGVSCRAVATLFGVSVSSIVRWSQRQRRTGSAAAKPMGGARPLVLAREREWLLARIAEKPELTSRAASRAGRARGGHSGVPSPASRDRSPARERGCGSDHRFGGTAAFRLVLAGCRFARAALNCVRGAGSAGLLIRSSIG